MLKKDDALILMNESKWLYFAYTIKRLGISMFIDSRKACPRALPA